MNMGETCVIVAQRHNEQAEIALSSLINALYELESYAVARYVGKDGQSPQMLLLMPSPGGEDGEHECLYDVPLPFAEDIRQYQFAPLDKVLTVTGSVLTKHHLLPSEKLDKAMSDYVDAMDLSGFEKDDEGFVNLPRPPVCRTNTLPATLPSTLLWMNPITPSYTASTKPSEYGP
jgi:ATP-dependent DNA helicase 2 subunit 2